MNTLAYILLCVLLSKPRSGYELKQLITIFWEAHHSQIYTTLAKLDQQGYVTVLDKHEHSQKKIYHLTDEGRVLVEEWIKEETPAPTQKDEFLAKIYAFSTLDKTTATGLLFTREQQLNKIMQKNQKKLNDLSLDKKQEFGRYVVIQRRIMLCQQELQWCQQVREQMQQFFE
ncbi:TPA: PadR family transcriptional regulator [Enterococcus faecium]|nr:PadR family transcriptional regulator [Enterococcus faecium]HAQ4565865.1 PadR family transcriptional regulator [Enterococcus faecium]